MYKTTNINFYFWVRNWSHIATHLVAVLVGVMLFKKAYGSVVLNCIRMKSGRIVLQVNMHWLVKSAFCWDVILSRWWPWRPPTTAYAAMSAGCPLAHRACVTTLAHCMCYSSWSTVHSSLLVNQPIFLGLIQVMQGNIRDLCVDYCNTFLCSGCPSCCSTDKVSKHCLHEYKLKVSTH